MSRNLDRRILLGCAAVIAVLALAAGFMAGAPNGVDVVYAAACQATNGVCSGGWPWSRTAAVDVSYLVPNGGGGGTSDMPVEPSGNTTWNITAYWNSTGFLPCYEHSETASVTVSWSGTGWTLSNKNTTTNITDIDICAEDTCSEEDTHSHGYRLSAEVGDALWLGRTHNLRQVVFATTAVSDGYELDTALCELDDAVTVTSQSFSATDSGTFECHYSCDNSGTTLDITYE